MASLRAVRRFAAAAGIAAAFVCSPAGAQVKSTTTMETSRTDRPEEAGPAVVGKSRDRGPGLMGRAVWGQTGALRLVLLRWPPPGAKTDRSLRVRIVNEGEEPF